MQQKKIPLRKCTGCGEMKPKKELVRVVKTPDDKVLIDLTGRVNGRGAYICPDEKCLRIARKSKRIERIAALENIVPTEEEINEEYDRIVKAYGIEADKVRELVDEAMVKEDVSVKKAVDFVKEKAAVTEKAYDPNEAKADEHEDDLVKIDE